MVHKLLDRTSESTTGGGTGNFDFAGAEQNCFAFSAGLSNGDTTDYFAVGAAGEFEFGKLTYVSSGNEATRSVVGGSNGASPVNFTQAPKVTACVGAASLKGQWVEITRTVASNAPTVDFVLPAGYDRYRIECHNVAPQSDADIRVRTSTNGGSSYDSGASDYDYSGLHISGATITGFNSNGDTAISITPAGTVESAPNMKMSGEIEIINPSAASYCTMKIECRYQRDDGTSYSVWMTGRRATGADVDAVRIFGNGANSNGTFVLLARRK